MVSTVSDTEGEQLGFRGIEVAEARAEKWAEIKIKIGPELPLDLARILITVDLRDEKETATVIEIYVGVHFRPELALILSVNTWD